MAYLTSTIIALDLFSFVWFIAQIYGIASFFLICREWYEVYFLTFSIGKHICEMVCILCVHLTLR